MKHATIAVVIKFLTKEVLNTFGVPEIIHSDNGKQFVPKTFVKMTKNYQSRHTKTAIYSPSSNAAERVNQSVSSNKSLCVRDVPSASGWVFIIF